MPEGTQTQALNGSWRSQETGPATLRQVIERLEQRVAAGSVEHLRPLPTGFRPLDDVLSGGLRPGELMLVGGPHGVGKTIFGLQVARNAAHAAAGGEALYVCYEHDRTHLLSRLLCLESVEQGCTIPLTLKKLGELALSEDGGLGLLARLRRTPGYRPVVDAVEGYADRLMLVKASGDHSTLAHLRRWVHEVAASAGSGHLLVVVDYLQKIPVDRAVLQMEAEVTTHLTQGLKELAMSLGVQVIAVAAADRPGLQSKRVRFEDLRGSSALQYEADVGLMLNNKHDILSREHLIANLTKAEQMRNWVVMSVEKNRAGRNAVDMQYVLQAAQFRMVPTGDFVRERLVDEKVILE
jgi:replicative DNA helicase